MKILSKILFYLSSFSILPPKRERQVVIIELVQKKHSSVDSFLRNSLCQYDCQSYFFLKPIWLIFGLFSILFFLPLLLILVLRGFRKSVKKSCSDISLYHKIPLDIRARYNPVYISKPLGYLKYRDLKFINKILFKSGFRPYFIFRSIWKIAIYSEIMDRFAPQRIWVTQEMVFESSLLTHYLNEFSVEHINFQHGDNYFSIQVAFSSFNQLYVWDDFYIDLFKSLRCNIGEFYTFSALDRLTSAYSQRNVLKYYNQESRSLKDFNRVLDNLVKFATDHDCYLAVRLHPLHQKNYELQALQTRNIEIESSEKDTIDSIFESKYVCSEFSSVLYQASLLNKTIVVDNTFQERFEIIKDLDVIFLKKLKHLYLVIPKKSFVEDSSDRIG